MVAGKGLKIDCQGHLGQVHSSKSEATVEGFFVLACLFLYSPSVWYIFKQNFIFKNGSSLQDDT
jgi:hypothetical protein